MYSFCQRQTDPLEEARAGHGLDHDPDAKDKQDGRPADAERLLRRAPVPECRLDNAPKVQRLPDSRARVAACAKDQCENQTAAGQRDPLALHFSCNKDTEHAEEDDKRKNACHEQGSSCYGCYHRTVPSFFSILLLYGTDFTLCLNSPYFTTKAYRLGRNIPVKDIAMGPGCGMSARPQFLG